MRNFKAVQSYCKAPKALAAFKCSGNLQKLPYKHGKPAGQEHQTPTRACYSICGSRTSDPNKAGNEFT